MTHHDDPRGLGLPAPFRGRLADAAGPRFWRSLDELAGTPEFRDYLAHEFPDRADVWDGDGDSRRQFLRLMGASLALAGASGCAFQPPEQIVPYVRQPEEIVPGKPLSFATAVTLGGYAMGVLVESHMGRPTKIEGNPDHPASLGATDTFAQAAVLELYDPDRSQVVTRNGRVSTWGDLLGVLTGERAHWRTTRGAGLRILTGAITSPTLARQLAALLEEFPAARWHVHEPAGRDSSRAGSLLAFDEEVEAVYHFDRADVIVALDADFLQRGPDRVRAARQFAARREPANGPLNRLYAAEPTPTVTGSMADHRLPVTAARVAALARALAHQLRLDGAAPADLTEPERRWVSAAADDLESHRGRGLVLVGDDQPAEVQALGHALNAALGNSGQTVTSIEPVEARPRRDEQGGTLAELVRDMAAPARQVETLFIVGCNPAYSAPADLDFASALGFVRLSVHLGLYDDETAELCNWHVPEAHTLETWGDARAFDGTATIMQPLIAPLFGGRTASELLAALAGNTTTGPRELVRETWRQRHGDDGFEAFWRKCVHDGIVAGTAAEARTPSIRPLPQLQAAGAEGIPPIGLELVFRPDPTIWDGRFANNGWLQELPKPMSKLTWDNAAFLSPATAERLQVRNEDVVELSYAGRRLEAPVWIAPGQADGSVVLTLGYGRRKAGRVGTGAGVSAYALRTSESPHFGPGLSVTGTGRTSPLASTQHHFSMEGRDLVRVVPIGELDHYHPHEHPAISLFENPEPQQRRQKGFGNAWGMVINLNTCIGCGTCTIACVAENNIPVVGKDQVRRGREMHWIRVDRYYEGTPANPRMYHQPLPCMHCETAPCELVCPVAATTHSAEGLNEMTYNRCVGTRYCSNNCPYKVRRFNFLQYTDPAAPVLKMLANPDVTVRTRGVMEKCTYCVQRINHARMAAQIAGREEVRYGEVQTACQQACPTQAILFGNLNDKGGEVAKARADEKRNYGLLAELNTRPRTTYWTRLVNPHAGAE